MTKSNNDDVFSLNDVKCHNDRNSAWILIGNDIYDVTSFLNEHPGGEEVLLEQAGKDGTESFEDVGHSSDARALMLKYRVGTLVEAERKKNTPNPRDNWANQLSASSSATSPPSDGTAAAGAGNNDSKNCCQKMGDSVLKQWAVPVVLGVVATLIYRFYFMS